MVRVELPFHLRKLADVDREVTIDVPGVVTQRAIIDAIEARYPMLRGTIRDYSTDRRRPFLRGSLRVKKIDRLKVRMTRCRTPSRPAPSRP
jgi:hypothetical protein